MAVARQAVDNSRLVCYWISDLVVVAAATGSTRGFLRVCSCLGRECRILCLGAFFTFLRYKKLSSNYRIGAILTDFFFVVFWKKTEQNSVMFEIWISRVKNIVKSSSDELLWEISDLELISVENHGEKNLFG